MKTITLDEEDIKILKRKKLFQLIFFIYMILVCAGILALNIYLYVDKEPDMAKIMMVAWGLTVFVVVTLFRNYKRFQYDLESGVKEVIEGTVTGKHSHKNRFELEIDGKNYVVKYEHYFTTKKGQQVLVAFATHSKQLLNIAEIPEHEGGE